MVIVQNNVSVKCKIKCENFCSYLLAGFVNVWFAFTHCLFWPLLGYSYKVLAYYFALYTIHMVSFALSCFVFYTWPCCWRNCLLNCLNTCFFFTSWHCVLLMWQKFNMHLFACQMSFGQVYFDEYCNCCIRHMSFAKKSVTSCASRNSCFWCVICQT